MPGNNRLVPLKKLLHLRLSQPDGFILEMDIHRGMPILRLIQDDFAKIGIHIQASIFTLLCQIVRRLSLPAFQINVPAVKPVT
jgi:hypothetical protein